MKDLMNKLYTSDDLLIINRFKNEGVEEYKVASDILRPYADHRLQKTLLEGLQKHYDQAIVLLAKIKKPNLQITPLLPLSEINKTLIELAHSMIYTLDVKVDSQIDSISDYISTKNLTLMYYDLISEKVAYGVLCATSSLILGMLSYHIESIYIFHYIRDHIVKPNLYKMLENYKADITQKDSHKSNNIKYNECYKLLNSFIYTILISMDTQLASKTLQELTNYMDIAKGMILDIVNKSQYLIPNFIIDLFTNNQSTQEMAEFLKQYCTTFSKQATLELFKKYCNQSPDFINKFNLTFKERIEINPVIAQGLDGLSLVENHIIQRLISLTPLNDDELNIVRQSYILSNIKTIIDNYKDQQNLSIQIDNNELIIKSDQILEKKFAYRLKEITQIFNNPFNIFKTQKSSIERKYNENDLQCPLFQSAIAEPIYKRIGTDKKLSVEYNLNTVEKRVLHRQKLIKQLQSELVQTNPEVVQKSNYLIEGNIQSIKYMNTSQSSNYIYKLTDKASTLLILSEIEGIYQLVQKYNTKTNVKNDTPITTQEVTQQNTDLELIRNSMINSSLQPKMKNMDFNLINLRHENMY